MPNKTTPDDDWLDLREKLAAIEHERWADWQKWCHKVLREELNPNGMHTNLEDVLVRWDKQIETPYSKLLDKEKASDMEQVDRYWPVVESAINAKITELLVAELANIYVVDGMLMYTNGGSMSSINDRVRQLQK